MANSGNSRRLRITLQLLGAGLLIFLLCEAGLRLLQVPTLQYFRNIKLLHSYHPDYLVGLAPNVDLEIKHYDGLWEGRFTTNSRGERGSPEPDLKWRQLLCLGDSIVMGFGVSDNETFCSRLNGIELGGERHQAINLGVDAFGTRGSALRLAEAAPGLNVSAALMVISPNDFTMVDEMRALGELADDEKDELREKNRGADRAFFIQFEMTRYSYLLQALKLSAKQLLIKWVGLKRDLHQEFINMGLLKTPGSNSRRSPLGYISSAFYRFKEPHCRESKKSVATELSPPICPQPVVRGIRCEDSEPNELEALPEITIRYYRHMLKTARRHNFKLIPVLLPIQNEVLQCYQNGRHSRHFNYALRAKKFFESEGVEVMDLRPYIQKMCGAPLKRADGSPGYSKISDYFIPMDGHFTVLGNNWAANALRRELQKRWSEGESR